MAQWRASGLSGRAFAETHGLSAATLYRWARGCGESDRQQETMGARRRARAPAFSEIKIRDDDRAKHGDGLPAAGVIEIESRSGRVVRVLGDVDVDRLRAVLEVVEQC